MNITFRKNYFYVFILLYGFSYMCNAVYGTFIPVYLSFIGYSKTNIGILLSLAPIVAILAQPLWGTLSDRAKVKNTILKILIAGSALSVLFYRLSTNFFYLSFIITCFTFFQTSINPMSDAITLEYTTIAKWKFGHIRLAGTIGYSSMAALAGTLLMGSIYKIFNIYFILSVLTFGTVFLLPKIKGHQFQGKKFAIWSLFREKKLLIYMVFSLIIQITIGFYNTFFAIYYQQLGASNALIGWAAFISGISEIPFLLWAHVLLKKIKTHHALLFAGSLASIRWFLLGIVKIPYLVLILQSMHGLIYIVITVSLVTYINESVPKELRASGQALNGIFGMGIARVIGSLFGGYLSDAFGIRRMFLYNSIFTLAAVIIFGAIFYAHKEFTVRDQSLK